MSAKRMREALERIEAAVAKVTPGDPAAAAYALGAISWAAAYGLRGDAAFAEDDKPRMRPAQLGEEK